ncbi:MAG: glutathione S-transferase family protein [Arenibacterium sp.]
MTDLILHHYPPSPVSEKIRTALGIKGLPWYSVEQNRLPDRPELFAMTGGYRRIPVMQIGADIYCDTQIIFRALENHTPSPSLFPGGRSGVPFALSRWTDDELFKPAMKAAFAPAAASLPPELVADRTRLYLGPDGDMAKELADLPHTLAQLRAQLGWVDDELKAGDPFLSGAAAGMSDLLVWHIVWFVKGRYAEAGTFLAEFSYLNAWADRMTAIGHGTSTDMSPADALDIARTSSPRTPQQEDSADPQGLTPGQKAQVAPLTDSGETAVAGVLRAITRDTVTLTLDTPECGEVAVHFPRVGYRVTLG